jgi:hypothetical protein
MDVCPRVCCVVLCRIIIISKRKIWAGNEAGLGEMGKAHVTLIHDSSKCLRTSHVFKFYNFCAD